jgi:hypothetical protein
MCLQRSSRSQMLGQFAGFMTSSVLLMRISVALAILSGLCQQHYTDSTYEYTTQLIDNLYCRRVGRVASWMASARFRRRSSFRCLRS